MSLQELKNSMKVTCLVIQIKNFRSVHKYWRMQLAAQGAGKDVFKSYFAICKVEKFFLPGCTDILYEVSPPMQHQPSNIDAGLWQNVATVHLKMDQCTSDLEWPQLVKSKFNFVFYQETRTFINTCKGVSKTWQQYVVKLPEHVFSYLDF